MWEEIGRFEAQSDCGTTYTVIERQRRVGFQPLSGSSSNVGGEIISALSDGRSVSYIDSETYKIVDTNETIRKIR